MMLKYRSKADIEDLQLFECTMHRCSGSGAGHWWQLWFHVLRDDNGQPEIFCVPMNPGGSFGQGPGGKTWGLTAPDATMYEAPAGTRNWQVSPSINVIESGDAHDGAHAEPSLWHQTPTIVGVPIDESWANGAAP